MSYANVKSFILILLLAAVNCMVLRPKSQSSYSASSSNYGSGSSSGNSQGGNIFSAGISGYKGLADIGVSMNEFNDVGAGGAGGFGGIGDIGLGDLTSGGNNLWAEFQDIINSVGGIGSSNSIGDIGLTASDFNFGSASASSGSSAGSYGSSGSSGYPSKG